MAAIDYYQSCQAWGIDIEDPQDESVPCLMFKIEFFTMLLLKPLHRNRLELDGTHYNLVHDTFMVESDRMISHNTNVIHDMFLAMQVTPQQYMINTMLNCAHYIVSNEPYIQNRNVLGMQVNVVAFVDELPANHDGNLVVRGERIIEMVPINQDYDYATIMAPTLSEFELVNFPEQWMSLDSEEVDSDFDELSMMQVMEEDSLMIIPACKESIEKLKIVEVEDSMTSCVICMEDLEMGSKATKMPCLHIFHGDCIVQWLEKRNSCPLCRFELPSCNRYATN